MDTKEKKKIRMREYRLRKKKALLGKGLVDGRIVCSKCFRNKLESEYSPRANSKRGKLNKVCDSCLTSIYACNSRASEGFDPVFWRKRAYTCNTAFRAALAKEKDVKVSEVKLKDLPHVCKPQELSEIFLKQDGKCYYCKCLLTTKDTSVDHATPISRGGSHEVTNYRLTCGDCNRLKFTRTEAEFLKFIMDYSQRFKVTEFPDKEPGR